MPLKLDSPTTQQVTIDTVEINAFAADVDRQELHVTYDEGTTDANGTFVPVHRDRMLTLAGQDFFGALAKADAHANAMPAGSVSVYGAIKLALYDKLREITGFTGTVQ